ncbi:MAG: hypothetical protein PW788_03265 [Micavibrio sp.]|nr:hypothetical protein [Micavibrio sp.]
MFGLGGPSKEMKAARTGAREKLAKAREAARNLSQNGDLLNKDQETVSSDPRVGAAIVYAAALILAFVLAEGPIAHGGINIHTGSDGLDRLMFSGTPASFSSNQSVDYILTLMIRAFIFWIAAGILPFISLAWQRALDQAHMNPFRIMWGMPIALTTIYFISRDYLGPLAETLLGMMR